MVGAEVIGGFGNREMRRRARWIAAVSLLIIAGALFTVAFQMLRREYADQALLMAVRSGNVSAAAKALRAGADPNLRGARFHNDGERHGLWQHVSAMLIRCRASRPSPQELGQPTALMLAVSAGRLNLVQTLIRSGADVNVRKHDGTSALTYAVWRGNLDVTRALLDQGADLNRGTPDGRTPLLIAAKEGQTAALRLLLARGANAHIADVNGETPLILAAYRGSTALLDLLLRAGCKIDAADYQGLTALHVAAEHFDPACLNLLLARGADVNPRDTSGETPLLLAVKCGRWKNARLLAAHGAGVNARDTAGRTPLMQLIADAPMEDETPLMGRRRGPTALGDANDFTDRHLSQDRCLEGVRLLTELGADVNARDRVGETALRDAIQFQKQENVIAALKQAGAHL